MHHVGIDLAWGTRRPTGVAVLDDEGRLLTVTTVRTDAEVLAAVAPYVEGPCTVAVDAPLLVTNPTGNRLAERELNADFARFDAGAHPTNTGKAEFREGSRGGALAAELDLDLDPGLDRPADDRRRALEVYPHAATVALFRLGRTLKYKQKPGRDLEQLRGALLHLMGLLEGLHDAHPPLLLGGRDDPWASLRRDVEQAERKSQLRVVEDQVDAVVCAYVALHATRRPAEVTVYGDPETGQIVTPTLPPDHRPTPRERSVPTPDPDAAVTDYALRRPALVEATRALVDQVTRVLDDGGINYLSVTSRAKTVASYAEKARRTAPDGTPLYDDPGRQITDVVGLRVITYVQRDVDAVAGLLGADLHVIDDRDMGRETARAGRFGYSSRHLLVETDDGVVAQVQVRTVLQHAWAEFEHDIRYKGTVPAELSSDFDRRFTLAAGLLELADQEFATIRDTLRAGPSPTGRGGIAARELAAFLAGQYADAGWSRTDHYDWMAELVSGLGIGSLDELAETLRPVDEPLIAARMDYRYPPGAVRRLDDALLWARGEQYVALPGNAHRTDLLHARLARLRGD
ncbi:DUF429 domain-containing protein [Nocardioides marmoraquaticus]